VELIEKQAGMVNLTMALTLQDVDTGEVLMQAYTDRAGITETLDTRCPPWHITIQRPRVHSRQ
jgi:phosphoribosyl-AMP cyclohydrolase